MEAEGILNIDTDEATRMANAAQKLFDAVRALSVADLTRMHDLAKMLGDKRRIDLVDALIEVRKAMR